MLVVLLHCKKKNIGVHHKVLFPGFLHATNHKKRVAKCMNALNFDISDEAVALHYNMHETGDKVVRYFAAN